MKRIIGIGNALVDITVLISDEKVLEEFGLPKGSMQLVDRAKSRAIINGSARFEETRTSGGSAANTIHGMAMLGADTGFIGAIGRDETGDFFEKDMKKAGVNTLLFRRNSATGTAVDLITPDSERTFATHLGAAGELSDEDIRPMLFNGYEILYLEGYLINNLPLIESACRLAKDNNMLVALDMASYNVVEAYLESFGKIIKNYVDILFSNEQEARAFAGLDTAGSLSLFSSLSKVAVLKVGAEGSWIKSGDETIRISAFPADTIDTTGAGDLYAAGFLYGYSSGLDLEKCGMIGSLMAARVIEVIGARMSREKFSELKSEINVIAY